MRLVIDFYYIGEPASSILILNEFGVLFMGGYPSRTISYMWGSVKINVSFTLKSIGD